MPVRPDFPPRRRRVPPTKAGLPKAVEVDTAASVARLIVEQEKEWKSVVVKTRRPVALDEGTRVVPFVMF